MDLRESTVERAFRQEVRSFIAGNLPKDLKQKSEAGLRMHVADGQRWHKILAGHGWGAPGWPKEYGGCGWDHGRQYIWEEEMAQAGCPPLSPFAVKMVGPVIMAFGTPEQKARFLPPAGNGEHLWCQGYSEPNAGSDLATLRTMAVRKGDTYVVNGTKIWNSYGHEADWMFALVRTSSDGKTQEGISVLLIDMASKGLSHRPIITIDGSHILNEIRFENVEVPVDNRIGEDWAHSANLIPVVMKAALGVGPAVQVFGTDYPTPDGTAIRDYIHVEDLANAHVLALDYLSAGGESCALNLGTGTGSSVLDVVRATESIADRTVPVELAPRRLGDPISVCFEKALRPGPGMPEPQSTLT